MADFRFKDLTVDNAFDFCEVLAVIGVEQVIGAFDKDEIQQLRESGTDMKEVGIVIAMKVCGILIKNISKANPLADDVGNFEEFKQRFMSTAPKVEKIEQTEPTMNNAQIKLQVEKANKILNGFVPPLKGGG